MLKAVLAEAGRNAPVSPRQEMAARLPALRAQRALFGCGSRLRLMPPVCVSRLYVPKSGGTTALSSLRTAALFRL